jgi:membrane-bound lytic murein transglycosylase C
MGSRTIKTLFFLIFLSISLSALDFDSFKKEQDDFFIKYQKSSQSEFDKYKKAYTESFSEYKEDISKFWPTKEVSTQHKWVEYDSSYLSKKTVDYEKEELSISIIEKDEETARKKIKEQAEKLFTYDVDKAYKNDLLEKKILKKLNKPVKKIESKDKIISDLYKKEDKKKLFDDIKTKKLIKVKHNNKFIYKLNVKLPSNSTINKARKYKSDIISNSKKQEILPELVYAIVHSESSFNPMARSHIPAYGLMQIVPKTAGVDAYKFLYGKKRVLSSNYLYNSSKNIKIGSAYIHILYYKYLKKIKNPVSRMYCTIAAYNTGAGNVAKAFIGNYNISKASVKINSMEPQAVYKHLMKKLPYNETKKYLVKVTDRVSSYKKLLNTKL